MSPMKSVLTGRLVCAFLPAPIVELHTLSQDFNSLLTELEAWENHMRNENVSLTKKALHDGLTGLHNRAFFIDTLNQCFNR